MEKKILRFLRPNKMSILATIISAIFLISLNIYITLEYQKVNKTVYEAEISVVYPSINYLHFNSSEEKQNYINELGLTLNEDYYKTTFIGSLKQVLSKTYPYSIIPIALIYLAFSYRYNKKD
ncbi:hypothetical protein J4233_01840 [Candidatus Pacearchaeota archaeon]|nr:hypothetical protein [Candidatus Pacearchaeota archaeon]